MISISQEPHGCAALAYIFKQINDDNRGEQRVIYVESTISSISHAFYENN